MQSKIERGIPKHRHHANCFDGLPPSAVIGWLEELQEYLDDRDDITEGGGGNDYNRWAAALRAARTEPRQAVKRLTESLERHRAGEALSGHAAMRATGVEHLQSQLTSMREALSMIRHCWAGHAEQCAFVTTSYRGKCDCDWPKVAAQCDAALKTMEQGE